MLFNSPEKRLPGFKLALAATIFTVFVIVLGAFTRLVDAGLGCPDWPGCYGHILWPMDAEDVAAANAAFPDTPVEHDKTWPEQVHRLLASSLGLFCIALVIFAWRQRRVHMDQLAPFKLPFFLLGPRLASSGKRGALVPCSCAWIICTGKVWSRHRPMRIVIRP